MNEPTADRIRSEHQITDDVEDDDLWDALVAEIAAIEFWKEMRRRINEATPDSAEKAALLKAIDFRIRAERNQK